MDRDQGFANRYQSNDTIITNALVIGSLSCASSIYDSYHCSINEYPDR